MKKTIAFLLVLLMTIGGGAAAFAASGTAPSDVTGTPYEDAVKALIEKDILSGYGDGTFRPQENMDRAEACAVVVKAMNPVGADLYNAKDASFSDMKDYDWAANYVNYAVQKGVVKGQFNGTFNPSGNISYDEMATMLVNAVGYTAKDLTGTWPESYVNKAKELGIFNEITALKTGSAPVSRGDVALMVNAVADKIAAANPAKLMESTKTTSGAFDNGKLNDNTGRVFGMILGSEKVKNAEGKQVDQIKFLMGNQIYYLNTDGEAAVPAAKDYLSNKGELYVMKMSRGVVTKIGTDAIAMGAQYFEERTATKGFEAVTAREKNAVTTEKSKFSAMDQTIFYTAQFTGNTITGYVPATLRDISAGCKVRAFDITDNKNNAADVMIIVKADDAKKIG